MAESDSGKLTESSNSVKEDEIKKSTSINDNNDDINIDPSKICSPSGLVPTKIHVEQSSNTSEAKQSIFKSSSLLRPSQLNGNVGSSLSSQKSAFLLNPSRLNPFAKPIIENKDESIPEVQSEKQSSSTDNNSNSAPKFLPLLQNGSKSETTTIATTTKTATASTSTLTQSSNFVFGQNIQERVVSDSKLEDVKSSSCSNANGTSDMLFSSALKESTVDTISSRKLQANKSLSESAREYEESRAVKRKYEEVEVKTGEEGETNVLQITCKLFTYDKSTGGSWQERGRGILRLNDQESEDGTHSRLVFRATGSLRVVFNTKVWADMTVELASNKSIRLTAFDNNGDIKVFLLMGSPEDMKHLQKNLEIRLQKEVDRQKANTKQLHVATENN